MKVTVIGANGGIGQPLSLLLKTNPNINELSLYDIVDIHGIVTDLSHIDTDVKIQGHNNLREALRGSNIVILLSGICRQPGMGRGDLFNINGKISYEICSEIINECPDSTIMVISNPINSMVPLLKELLVTHEYFDCNKLIGVTFLDVVRSNTFLGELKNKDPALINVKVIGGHSGHSIVPLFGVDGTEELINKVQYGGDEVVTAKEGRGSATLSAAYSINKLLNIFLLGGTSCSYIYLDDQINGVKELKDMMAETLEINKNQIPKYLSVPIIHGTDGKFSRIETDWIATLTDREKHLLITAFKSINQNIEKGETFEYHNR